MNNVFKPEQKGCYKPIKIDNAFATIYIEHKNKK